MRLVIVAFFTGILLFQQLPELPAIQWCLLFLVIIPVFSLLPVSRPPLAIVSGFLWALLHAYLTLVNTLPQQVEGKDIILEGIISAIPERRINGVRFQFDIKSMHLVAPGTMVNETSPRRVLLSWYGKTPQLAVGDKWRLKARLKRKAIRN